jgi:hypothetical protein
MEPKLTRLDARHLAHDPWQPTSIGPSVVDAWRQTHYAAQVAAELGKSWAAPRDDDSHSNFGWVTAEGVAGFEGVASATDPPLSARLLPRDLTLALAAPGGAAHETFACHNRTLADAHAWLERTATRLAGPRRQPAIPAPDLPDHPVASGAPFDASDTAAFANLADLYANTDALLRRLVTATATGEPPRCWPHHFDHAALVTVRQDASGVLAASIGVGLTPPDPLAESGYWYVGPWSREPVAAEGAWDALPAGHWAPRPGTLPLAVLPVADVAAITDAAQQQLAVAGFVASAFNASLTRLT